ncbi:GIY-YIG nuclease family protein [Nocardia flavorosea]|uniref:GIY-YIG nuclease family protein n=1 Tax=Nocardia flavorosea TaxID=53429 RepID=A0A846YSB8_9NOCA|nr:GIY-YIG nuclease family protein [Nocardia flavorosea]NKY60374.1 GIY-YIG nuclease family protein [Nocardia flavorosea]
MPAADAFASSVSLCTWHWQKAIRDFNVATETLRAFEFEREEKVREVVPADAERLRWSCPGCGDRDTLWVDSLGETTRCVSCSFERDEREYRRRLTQSHLFHGFGKSVVYYLRFGPYLKIGYTGNLGVRLSNLVHDEVPAIEFGARKLEKKRHGQFRSARHTREWFRLTPGLVDHIEDLRASEAPERAAA